MKLYVQIEFYDVNFKWHMQISCRMIHTIYATSKKIYVNFWDNQRARFPEKSKTKKHVSMRKCYALDFPGKRARYRSPFFIFFRIHGYGLTLLFKEQKVNIINFIYLCHDNKPFYICISMKTVKFQLINIYFSSSWHCKTLYFRSVFQQTQWIE